MLISALFEREDATTTLTEENDAPPFFTSVSRMYFLTTRRGIRQCGAKRARACAPLSASSGSWQRFRGCVCVWGMSTMSIIHRRTYGSDRLVPPRLRRTAYLLTEYHRDSYIATIVVHTPATGMACWSYSRERLLRDESWSSLSLSYLLIEQPPRWRSADRDHRSAILKLCNCFCNCQSANLSFSRFSSFDRFA